MELWQFMDASEYIPAIRESHAFLNKFELYVHTYICATHRILWARVESIFQNITQSFYREMFDNCTEMRLA